MTADDHWLACSHSSCRGALRRDAALHTGTRLTVIGDFDVDAVERSGATLVSLVSTALRRVDTSHFRAILLGGARPPRDLPPNVVATYGMTETGSGVVYDGVPLDGVEVRIAAGEVHLRCPMLFRCYRDGTSPLVDGWFATGDGGRLGPDGKLVVDGRIGELIITGGENVWPQAVEAVLSDHPGVRDVAVAGRPDAEWGETVVAYVVPDGSPPSLDELRDHVKASLPAYCAPRAVVLIDAVPRTTLGKIVRTKLGEPVS